MRTAKHVGKLQQARRNRPDLGVDLRTCSKRGSGGSVAAQEPVAIAGG